MSKDIHNRVLLVSLSISTWTARKFDRTVTNKVNRDFGAPSDAGRYNKHLLAGEMNKSYRHLINVAQNIRLEHYNRTLPWTDEGWRILPTDQYMSYMEWYRAAKVRFEAALRDFTADYPSIRSHQCVSNPMFKTEDYPDLSVIEGKFGMRVDVQPLSTTNDIRVNLSREQVAEIEKSMTERAQQGIEVAMNDAWQRLYKVTEHIAIQCGNSDAKLYKSTVEHAREICNVLVTLNITGDADLEAMRRDVEQQLTVRDVEDLRDNPSIRSDVAEKANEILRRMTEIGYGA